MGRLTTHRFDPLQFGLDLCDCQFQHPDGLVVAMADLMEDVAQRRLLPREVCFEKHSPPIKLSLEDAGRRLPGQRQERQKRRP